MIGFDCNCKLTEKTAKAFKDSGRDFAVRYVGRRQQASHDLDRNETHIILGTGLQLGVVQHCPQPGWITSKALGQEYGYNAAKFSLECDYENGKIVYLDLEGIKAGVPKAEIIAFCNAWYDEVVQVYTPGIYVGFDTHLTGEELYRLLKFEHYWKSLSNVPAIPIRGYEMIQKGSDPFNGIDIDLNIVTGDNRGNFPLFMKQERPARALLHTVKVYNDGFVEII